MEPTEEGFKMSPTYKVMERQIALLDNNVKDQQKDIESLNQVIVVQQTARKEYEEACAVSHLFLPHPRSGS